MKLKVWITGGGSGIGRALAIAYAARGHDVVITGRNGQKLDDVCSSGAEGPLRSSSESPGESETPGKAGSIQALVWDVSDDESVHAVSSQLQAMLQTVDIAILCAGICEYVDKADMSIASFRRVYAANVFGIVNSVNLVRPLLKLQPDGKNPQIVAVSSLSTATGLPRAEAYGSSKAAVDYLVDALTIDLGVQGVDVSLIQPGFVTTPMTSENNFPMPFEVDADTAAKRIHSAITRRKRVFRFPRRLYWLIKIASAWPFLWYRFVAPRLVRYS